MVLEKTLETPLDCKEIQLVHPKGNQSRIFIGSVAGKGTPFQGPKLGSCLILRSELSEEIHVLRKQEISFGKGTPVESRRVREPRRTVLPCGSKSRVLW